MILIGVAIVCGVLMAFLQHLAILAPSSPTATTITSTTTTMYDTIRQARHDSQDPHHRLRLLKQTEWTLPSTISSSSLLSSSTRRLIHKTRTTTTMMTPTTSQENVLTRRQKTEENTLHKDTTKGSSHALDHADKNKEQPNQTLASFSLPLLSSSSPSSVSLPEAAAIVVRPLWEASTTIPQWMKDYFVWHAEACANMSQGLTQWQEYDYLVVRCLEQDVICGGAADRLKPLPFFLLVAYRTHRLLYFKWQRPSSLESFLIPPSNGMNWTWPPHVDLYKHVFDEKPNIRSMRTLHNLARFGRGRIRKGRKFHMGKIASVLVQSHFHGALEYDGILERKYRNQSLTATATTNNTTTIVDNISKKEATYNHVFADCWKTVFVPSPPVQTLIDERMKDMGLIKDEYHAVHIRSQYEKKVNAKHSHTLATNAINCLAHYITRIRNNNNTNNNNNQNTTSQQNNIMIPFHNQTRIFVASDVKDTAQTAVQYAKSQGLIHATHLAEHGGGGNHSSSGSSSSHDDDDDDLPTLHLDRGSQHVSEKKFAKTWKIHEVPRYYDTFVDMYLLSNAKCIVYNIGVRTYALVSHVYSVCVVFVCIYMYVCMYVYIHVCG